jgi:hypothetical protein
MIKFDDIQAQELAEFAHAQERIKGYTRPWLVNDLMPQSYQDWAKAVLAEASPFNILRFQFWTAIDWAGEPGDLWVRKFPHNHKYDGVTLITFVEVPESGGEAVVFNDDMTIKEEITPEVGASVLVYDHEIHGARSVQGDKPRTIVIAGSFEHEKHICTCSADWSLWTNQDKKAAFG